MHLVLSMDDRSSSALTMCDDHDRTTPTSANEKDANGRRDEKSSSAVEKSQQLQGSFLEQNIERIRLDSLRTK